MLCGANCRSPIGRKDLEDPPSCRNTGGVKDLPESCGAMNRSPPPAAGLLYVLPEVAGELNCIPSPRAAPFHDLPDAAGATNRRPSPSVLMLSRVLLVLSTLRVKILSALLLASGEPNPFRVLIVLFVEVSGIIVRGELTPAPLLRSDRVLNVLPFPVRRVVTGLTRPAPVRVTGSTTATLRVTGSIIRLLTMVCLGTTTTAPFTTTAPLTTTVVKLWHIKKPGNQKPNHQLG